MDRNNSNAVYEIAKANCLLAKRIEELEKELEHYRWIPVEEQIPVDDTDVIVFKSGGIIDIAYWNGYAWRSFDSNYTLNVLAWMPLPDPFNPQN